MKLINFGMFKKKDENIFNKNCGATHIIINTYKTYTVKHILVPRAGYIPNIKILNSF